MNNFADWNNGNFLVVSGFAKDFCTQEIHDQFLKTVILENEHPGTLTIKTYDHPALNFIESKRNMLLDLVNLTFNLNVDEIAIGGTCIQYPNGLLCHNDEYDKKVVARGIVTINPTMVFGTNTYSNEYADNPLELGGEPGDLFIFKVSADSWHGAGLKEEHHEDRFSYNLNFYSSS